MMKKALACTMFIGVVFSLPAAADDTSLKFKGGIGVIPVSTVIDCPASPAPCVTGPPVTVNRNIVRGVSPAGQIWVIADLDAKVSTNGSITVKGKGLILAGGDNAGRAPALSVLATLICQPTAPFTQSLECAPDGGQFQAAFCCRPTATSRSMTSSRRRRRSLVLAPCY
jgi:hypothetical protein